MNYFQHIQLVSLLILSGINMYLFKKQLVDEVTIVMQTYPEIEVGNYDLHHSC